MSASPRPPLVPKRVRVPMSGTQTSVPPLVPQVPVLAYVNGLPGLGLSVEDLNSDAVPAGSNTEAQSQTQSDPCPRCENSVMTLLNQREVVCAPSISSSSSEAGGPPESRAGLYRPGADYSRSRDDFISSASQPRPAFSGSVESFTHSFHHHPKAKTTALPRSASASVSPQERTSSSPASPHDAAVGKRAAAAAAAAATLLQLETQLNQTMSERSQSQRGSTGSPLLKDAVTSLLTQNSLLQTVARFCANTCEALQEGQSLAATVGKSALSRGGGGGGGVSLEDVVGVEAGWSPREATSSAALLAQMEAINTEAVYLKQRLDLAQAQTRKDAEEVSRLSAVERRLVAEAAAKDTALQAAELRQVQLEGQVKAAARSTAECNQLRTDVQEEQARAEVALLSQERTADTYQAMLQRLQAEKDEQQQTIQGLEHTITTLRQEAIQAAQSEQESQDNLAQQRAAEKEALEKQAEEHAEQSRALQEQVGELERKVASSQEAMMTLSNMVSELRDTLEGKEEEHKEAQAGQQHLQALVQEKQAEVERLRTREALLTADVEACTTSLNSAHGQAQALQRQLEEQMEATARWQEDTRQQEVAALHGHRAVLRNAEQLCAEKEAELVRLRAQLNALSQQQQQQQAQPTSSSTHGHTHESSLLRELASVEAFNDKCADLYDMYQTLGPAVKPVLMVDKLRRVVEGIARSSAGVRVDDVPVLHTRRKPPAARTPAASVESYTYAYGAPTRTPAPAPAPSPALARDRPYVYKSPAGPSGGGDGVGSAGASAALDPYAYAYASTSGGRGGQEYNPGPRILAHGPPRAHVLTLSPT